MDGSVVPIEEGSDASAYLGPPNATLLRIGSKYMKAVFVEYTDETFTTRVNRSAFDPSSVTGDYLGLLGPVMRAQVG